MFIVKISPGDGSRVRLFNESEIQVGLEVFGDDGELYEDETCIGKILCDDKCLKEVTEEQAERGPGSVYRVLCLYRLGFAENVIRKLENAGLDSLLLKSILIV